MKDKTKTGIVIPWEVADGITLSTLKEQLMYAEKSLSQHDKKKSWMHPEDIVNYRENLIPALKTIIIHFGG